MAHHQQQEFCSRMKEAYPEYFKGQKVLDIGSLDINGNNRFLFSDCDYLGLDIGEGPNVDVISVGHLYDAPDEYFDTIISTEVFEHDMFYAETVKNIIRMLKPGGAFIFTCASTGRLEHGTRRSDGSGAAPLLIQISEEWADYYKNLTQKEFEEISEFVRSFPDGIFEYNEESKDLYFFGVKGGIKESQKYKLNPYPSVISLGEESEYQKDIFVVGAWPNTEAKELDLLDCINRLRAFSGIPILLVSHYPIKAEIQKLVDYYIFDRDNPVLLNQDFSKLDVASGRWTRLGDTLIENEMPFHHDYAIWVSMTHAFNFCKYLGKDTIHYLEYDNLIDVFQYKQAFLEKSKQFDAVIYEYREGSTKDNHLDPYMATYIFSAKTDILIKMMIEVKDVEDYFTNRPRGWQLERVFFHYLQKHARDITVTPYIANLNELNTQAVWNRDGILRDDGKFQIYLGADGSDRLFIHLISGFHEEAADKDYLLEIKYQGKTIFHTLKKGAMDLIDLGEYRRGYTVRVNYLGREVFSEFLNKSAADFRRENRITNKSESPNLIDVNFVDGPFVEIKGTKQNQYLVKFIDQDTDDVVYQVRLKTNEWAKCNRKWFTNWKIEIEANDDAKYEHIMNLADRRVYISFESSSLGDNLAWIPYVEEFRKKHKCKLIVSTFMNDTFRNQYPEIEFVNPGSMVHDIYTMYRLGCFYNNDQVDRDLHRSDFRKLRLQEYASDILGLDFEEIRPNLPKVKPNKSKVPYICIANHSTAQAKYWNNSTGWQDLVDYFKFSGYDVYLLSREEDGYMGNKNPKGVIHIKNKSIEEISSILLGSQGFVGISSGLSWLSWSLNVPTVIISGCTDELLEPSDNTLRVIDKKVCNSCFSKHLFDRGDWNWCPEHKGTKRQFECSKSIGFSSFQNDIEKFLKLKHRND